MAAQTTKPDARTLWIKARVRPDELAIVERNAALMDRTVSEYIRDLALGERLVAPDLSAYVRHNLNRVVARIKSGCSPTDALADLQVIRAEIDKGLEP